MVNQPSRSLHHPRPPDLHPKDAPPDRSVLLSCSPQQSLLSPLLGLSPANSHLPHNLEVYMMYMTTAMRDRPCRIHVVHGLHVKAPSLTRILYMPLNLHNFQRTSYSDNSRRMPRKCPRELKDFVDVPIRTVQNCHNQLTSKAYGIHLLGNVTTNYSYACQDDERLI